MCFVIAVINYEVTVVTGEVFAAGTDAKVFLQIYGEEGKTEVIQLKSRSNNFERGTTEIFKVHKHGCCTDLIRCALARMIVRTADVISWKLLLFKKTTLFYLITLPNNRLYNLCFYSYLLKQEYYSKIWLPSAFFWVDGCNNRPSIPNNLAQDSHQTLSYFSNQTWEQHCMQLGCSNHQQQDSNPDPPVPKLTT